MTERIKKKAGRKPLGDKAMTRNERMQKTNDARKARGVRSFLMHVEPMHLEWIEQMAQQSGAPVTTAFKHVVEAALDRYAGVMKRVQFLEVDCSNPEAAAAFVQAHLSPALPTLEELAAQFKKET
ncbi:hypothetical protein [Comamonas testosteroni]|uniref:hypothetical protein n=1 Tax=Comamonas testosteroni TaxID=285 RepID=UPI0003641BF0|nr:hypothetical protein [Comamonas testosteroni]